MTTENSSTCLNCRRDETQVPLIAWRYQGQPLWICSDCLPLLIHKREQLMAQRGGGLPPSQAHDH
jgi:hypothetical protein